MKTLKNLPHTISDTPATSRSQAENTTSSAHPMRSDPILQELWAIKAAINKEANYDAATLLRSAQSVVNGMRAA